MYSLLEHDTAGCFIDEFAEVAIDASQVIWIMTANDERMIPEPILNRMNVFEIEAPCFEMARAIARNLYVSIRGEHGWGSRFGEEPRDDVLDQLAELAPRDMRRALMTGFGNARLESRGEILLDDLPKPSAGRGRLGFLN
jgi:ATP-dependent Lon protease